MKLEQCADKFKAVLSYLNFTKFHKTLKKHYPRTKFSFEWKKVTENRLFLEMEMVCEGNKFVASIYWWAALNGANTHFQSHLPSTCKFSDLVWWWRYNTKQE